MNNGKCLLCEKEYKRSGMQTHLRRCLSKNYVEHALTEQYKSYFWLSVKDRYNDDFWLHILIEKMATLELLDAFLRGIWLECCGHLSEFRIGDMSFACEGGEFADSLSGMGIQLHKMLTEKDVFSYTYDFGSSTELSITVKGSLEEVYGLDSVILIARNNMPDYMGGNSPRTGVCGYVEDLSFECKTLKSSDYPVSKNNEHVYKKMAEQRLRIEMESMFRKVRRSGGAVFDWLDGKQIEEFKSGLETYLDRGKSKELVDMLGQFPVMKLEELIYFWDVDLSKEVEASKKIEKLSLAIQYQYLTHIHWLDSEKVRALQTVFEAGGICTAEQAGLLPVTQLWASQAAVSMLLIAVEGDAEGNANFIIPDEIYTLLEDVDWKRLNKEAKRNDQWIRYMKGLVYYYGVITFEDLFQEVNIIAGPLDDVDGFREVIHKAVMLSEVYDIFENYVVNDNVFDPKSLIREITLRTDIDRKRLDKKDVLLASDEDFIFRNKAVKRFEQFLRECYGANRESVEDFLWDIYDLMDENMSMNEVAEYSAIRFEMVNTDVMNEFMEHIIRIYNGRRQWQLKGYSPNELMGAQNKKSSKVDRSGKVEHVNFVTKKKVGRNDPCSCGSGLKYKYCCLGKR